MICCRGCTPSRLSIVYRQVWRRSQKFCYSLRHACECMICSINSSFVLRNDI
nr:MAG TPA: hypothetical protein [Caudoviricetes sp.]